MGTPRFKGPNPSVQFAAQVNRTAVASLQGKVTGNVTVTGTGLILGSSQEAGQITKVWISLLSGGRDDASTLKIAANVKINGTSCMTTQPAIEYQSGELPASQTTFTSGTGITQGVVDTDNNTIAAGDVISADYTVTRTSPDDEMNGLVVVAEFEPTN